MAGDEALGLVVSGELLRAVKVVLGHAAVLEWHGWEECVGPPVLTNQLVRDNEEHLRPDLTDGMDAPVATFVEGVVRRRVGSHVKRVRVVANAVRLVGSPGAHRPVVVCLGAANDGSQEVTPAFAHASRLAPSEAARVGGTTSKTSGESVRIFVNNDSGLEITITVGLSMDVPNVHTHPSILSIGRGHKVGVVVARSILGISNNGIVALATTTKVELLEVTRLFGETVTVE